MKRLAIISILLSGACSTPPAPRPELRVERAPDPEAERSLERHLQESDPSRVEILFQGKIRFVESAPDLRHPDYGLYANPIP
jgi:hypothetical protein